MQRGRETQVPQQEELRSSHKSRISWSAACLRLFILLLVVDEIQRGVACTYQTVGNAIHAFAEHAQRLFMTKVVHPYTREGDGLAWTTLRSSQRRGRPAGASSLN